MAFEDKTLVCAQCGVEFLFSTGEQEFYEKKGFTHAPKRCRRCRDSGRSAGAVHGPGRARHVEYVGSPVATPGRASARPRSTEFVEATCSACGAVTKLPFHPDGVRPVFCRTCFQERKRSSPSGRP